MSSIPEEIYLEIFLKVPVKSLLACKCVCKKWFSLISNPDFVKTQLNLTIKRDNPNLMLQGYEPKSTRNRDLLFYSISHDSLDSLLSTEHFHEYAVELDYPFKSSGYSNQLMGCCDGLVCLWIYDMHIFCLWNPATREYKTLPKSNLHYVRMVAFGYDCKCNDYKLFAAGSTSSSKKLFEMYSIALNSWKSIEEVPSGLDKGFKSGVLVNGNFHWLADSPEDCSDVLVSLDISNEIFKEMELPIETENLEDDFDFYEVGVLEGCLCLLENLYYDDLVNIWVMQNYGVRDSWTVRYTFKDHRVLNRDVRLTWFFKSGEILFRGVCTDGPLVSDPKYGRNREPNISGSRLYQQELYFESLVSLKSSTYVGGKEEIEEPNKKKTRN